MDINDRILSMRLHLYNLFENRIASENMRFETEQRVTNFTRPLWGIRRTNHRYVNLGKIGYRDDDQWNLTYYANGRQDADETLQQLEDSITSGGPKKKWHGRIPGWRFDWQYPQPVITQLNASGILAQGQQYSVRVSGIDLCDNESAASIPLLVTMVAPNNTLKVRILRQPFQGPLFKSYNVYVNGHLEVNIPHPVGAGSLLYPTAIFNSVTGTGLGPKEPANNVPIRWKFIRVDSYSDYTREDEVTDGIWNGYVTIETSVYQERERLQPDVVNEIVATQTIGVTPLIVPSQGIYQYIVTPGNPVKVGY